MRSNRGHWCCSGGKFRDKFGLVLSFATADQISGDKTQPDGAGTRARLYSSRNIATYWHSVLCISRCREAAMDYHQVSNK